MGRFLLYGPRSCKEGVANGSAGRNGNDDANTFLTRGRALYMYKVLRP